MTYYWMGHSLFLSISAGDHALAQEGFNSFTGGNNTNSVPDDYSPLYVSYSIIAFGVTNQNHQIITKNALPTTLRNCRWQWIGNGGALAVVRLRGRGVSYPVVSHPCYKVDRALNNTSKCMHGMNQTEAEYSRHGKRSQRASLSQIGPVVLDV